MSDEISEEEREKLFKKQKEWVAEQVRKFEKKMASAGIKVKHDMGDSDGEADAEKLKIEMDDEAKNFARKAQLEQDLIEIRDELRQENKSIPAGVTKLGPAQLGRGSDSEFDSYEAMIDALTEQEHSDNADERAYAKKVKNEMFRRLAVAIKKGELSRPISYEPKEGKSLLRDFLDRQNARMRRKILKSKGEEVED